MVSQRHIVLSCLSVMLVCFLILTGAWAQSPVQFDLRKDGQSAINFFDLLNLARQWGTGGQPGNSADWNGDGIVDRHDLMIFIRWYGSALPTATPSPTATNTSTETPTPSLTPTNTSTETPTPSLTPTNTSTETPIPTSTATPTLEPVTPTPSDTPTPTIPEPTPTNTPTQTASPTATDTPTPTPSPTEGPTVTPTPTPTNTPFIGWFVELFFDFENVTAPALPDGLRTETNPSAVSPERLLDSLRSPNDLFPWFTRDETSDNEALAYSGSRSASLNGRSGWYDIKQTSIMTIDQAIDTTQAKDPRLEFRVAYEIEEPGNQFFDFFAAEVSTDGGENFTFLDLNQDGLSTGDPRLLTFDGLSGGSDSGNDGLGKDDFEFYSVEIPSATQTVISFRFASDIANSNFRGVFLDDIRVYDAGALVPDEPAIDRVSVVGGGLIYADDETVVALQGSHLSPAQSVVLSFDATTQPLDFQIVSDEEIRAVIPRQATPELNVTTALTLTRIDGLSADYANLPILAAPTPAILTMAPSPIFLEADNPAFTLTGNHFRTPDREGRFASIVGIGQQIDDGLIYEVFTNSRGITSISRSEIEIDPFSILGQLAAGSAIVQVTNPFSGLVSEPFVVEVREGAGRLSIDRVLIGFLDRPFIQSDEEQTLIITGENFSQSRMNLSIGGIEVVSEGIVVDEARTQLFVDPTSITVVASPGVLTATGTVPVLVEIAGYMATSSYEVRDPLPPVLAHVEPATIDNSEDQFITITGDNFRGRASEEPTQVELLPADQSGDILPDGEPFAVDVSGLDVVIDSAEGADDQIWRVMIPKGALQVPAGETRYYRVRVTNPFSGLSTTEPRLGSVVADVLLVVSGGGA